MGYKLAGYDVLGGVEIDKEMMAVYRANHNPRFSYLMGVQDFKKIPDKDLPLELFNLDILDGSPPCSSFSMAGKRERKWGKETYFREGQAKQVLDDLFFDFIEVADKLKPKVVVAENVKGLLHGNARGYVKEIFQKLKQAGYDAQLFLLNAAAMGVPQRRERTFFVAKKLTLNGPSLRLEFNENQIPFLSVFDGKTKKSKRSLKRFGDVLIDMKRPISTVATLQRFFVDDRNEIADSNIIRVQSFPDDYRFGSCEPKYICGKSVPPFMMQRVAREIQRQWFSPTLLGESLQ